MSRTHNLSNLTHTKEEFIEAVKHSYTVAEVLRKLNLLQAGASYKAFYRKVERWEVDISHFDPHYYKKTENKIHNGKFPKKNLKSHLIKAGFLEEKCSILECPTHNLDLWCGKSITYHLDHIDGKRENNALENLRILCIMCHSQTSTFGGKNHKYRRVLACIDCGTTTSQHGKRCRSCAAKRRNPKIEWPPSEALIRMVNDSNYCVVARALGVTDNAIRKRLKTRPPKLE